MIAEVSDLMYIIQEDERVAEVVQAVAAGRNPDPRDRDKEDLIARFDRLVKGNPFVSPQVRLSEKIFDFQTLSRCSQCLHIYRKMVDNVLLCLIYHLFSFHTFNSGEMIERKSDVDSLWDPTLMILDLRGEGNRAYSHDFKVVSIRDCGDN